MQESRCFEGTHGLTLYIGQLVTIDIFGEKEIVINLTERELTSLIMISRSELFLFCFIYGTSVKNYHDHHNHVKLRLMFGWMPKLHVLRIMLKWSYEKVDGILLSTWLVPFELLFLSFQSCNYFPILLSFSN